MGGAWRGTRLAAGAIALALSASASAADDTGADDLGLWRACLAVGDGPGQVVARTDAFRDTMVAFGTRLDVDDKSVSLMEKIREAGIELDLGGLYGMLPEVRGPERVMRVHGAPQGDSAYAWTLFPALGAANLGQLGAIDGSSALAPVEQEIGKGKGFAVRQQLDVGTGPWRHSDVAALLEAFLVALEDAAGTTPDTAATARVAAQQPVATGDADRAILAAIDGAAPGLSQTLSRIVRVERVGTVGPDGLNVDFLGKLDLAGVTALGYPALATYVDKLDNLLVLDLSVRDGSGAPLVVVGFWSAGPGLRVAFTTHDGALVPTRKGVADPSRAVRPTQDVVDLRVRADTEVRAEGVLLRISDYEIPIAYRSGGTGADVQVPIRTEPRVEFTGQGTVSSWFAEAADAALNLESHGQVVFRAVAEGLDGNGSRASLRYDDHATNGVMSSSLDLFLIDNALVRMGFRIVGRSLTPDDAVVTEGLALTGRLIRDADRDYAAVRDQLAAADR